MTLLTNELKAQLPPLYATEKLPLEEKRVIAKFFDPCSRWTWLVVEGQEEAEVEDFTFWGLVRGHCDEWGYFSLNELSCFRNRLGLSIERDLHFRPATVAELLSGAAD